MFPLGQWSNYQAQVSVRQLCSVESEDVRGQAAKEPGDVARRGAPYHACSHAPDTAPSRAVRPLVDMRVVSLEPFSSETL